VLFGHAGTLRPQRRQLCRRQLAESIEWLHAGKRADVDQVGVDLALLGEHRKDLDQLQLIVEIVLEPERNVARPLSSASETFRFSAAVAEFGLLLRQSKFAEKASLAQVRSLAGSALGSDPHGTRHEFITLVEKARSLNL
jgi:Ca-activated chloride channel family protein